MTAPATPRFRDPGTRRRHTLQRLVAGLGRGAARVEHAVDVVRWGARRRFGEVGPVEILSYRGFGNRERLMLTGRVVEARRKTLPTAADRRWQNALRVLGDLNSREIPGAEVRARLGTSAATAVADDEGYFQLTLPVPPRTPAPTLAAPADWHAVDLDLVGCPLRDWAPVTTRVPCLIPGPRAQLAIVSDIDDTVLETHVTDRLRMVWTTLSGNAITRLSFPGTAALYRALAAGPTGQAHNPLFYLSKSPWNFYDFLVEFLDRQGLPRGPLFLRDVGLKEEAPVDFKAERLGLLFETYPQLSFLLLGDSGERDTEIYLDAAARYPGRVRAIYIREVTPGARAATAATLLAEATRLGTELVFFSDASAALAHARARGLVAPA